MDPGKTNCSLKFAMCSQIFSAKFLTNNTKASNEEAAAKRHTGTLRHARGIKQKKQ